MMQLLPRRAGRDPLESDRLVSGNYNDHYRQFRGGAIADWPETTKVPGTWSWGCTGSAPAMTDDISQWIRAR